MTIHKFAIAWNAYFAALNTMFTIDGYNDHNKIEFLFCFACAIFCYVMVFVFLNTEDKSL